MTPEEIMHAIQLLLAAAGAGIALWQWRQSVLQSRAKRLEGLLKEFNENPVILGISLNDDDHGAHEYFETRPEIVDKALNLVSFLCYLKEQKLVTKAEFQLLQAKLDRVLSDPDVRDYLDHDKATSVKQDRSPRYPKVIEYVVKNRIWESVRESSEIGNAGGKTNAGEGSPAFVRDIVPRDFTEPTILIKINRSYEAGMSPEEVLENTEKWWRINPGLANTAKLVLSVAYGTVVGVFEIDGEWEKDKTGDFGGRYRFHGHPAEESVTAKFMGRSVASLFTKGASNPIRYFFPQS